MQIRVDCPTCGHAYEIGHSIAGMKLKCSHCGATMVAHVIEESRPAAVEAPAAPSGPTALVDTGDAASPAPMDRPVVFHDAGQPYDVFRLGAADRHRKLAAIVSIALAALVYLCSIAALILAFGAGSFTRDQVLPPAALGTITTLLGIAAVIGFVLGTTYLLCGLKMSSEAFTPVLIVVNVSLVHGILTLALVALLLVEARLLFAAATLETSLTLLAGLLSLAALSFLVYFSTRILQIRR